MDLCENAFHRILEKLVDCNDITLSVDDEAEKEYNISLRSIEGEQNIFVYLTN